MSLPPKAKANIQAESYGSHSNHMTSIKANVASANNIIRHSAARMVDEPSPQQARAIDKILRLPK
jgi:hypothetical protein